MSIGIGSRITHVALSFGSNMGDRLVNIRKMEQMVQKLLTPPFYRSSLMETTPVDVNQFQPSYYNKIFCGYYSESAQELLMRCQEVELALGRDKKGLKAPRTADIDILIFGDAMINSKNLIVPHPQIYSRRYCLTGLNEAVPEWKVPGECLTIRELYAIIDSLVEKQEITTITGTDK